MTGVPLARGNSEGKGDPSEGTSKGGRRTEGGCATHLGVPLAFRGWLDVPYTHSRAGSASLVVDESSAGSDAWSAERCFTWNMQYGLPAH